MAITQEPYDALNQVWAGGPGGIGTSNSPLADFKNELQIQDGSATWTIVDLERKANINVANDALLQQALMVIGVDAGQFTPVVNSILDWIDRDENPRIQGAESDVYQGLTRLIFPKTVLSMTSRNSCSSKVPRNSMPLLIRRRLSKMCTIRSPAAFPARRMSCPRSGWPHEPFYSAF
jgi:hypothetical protein